MTPKLLNILLIIISGVLYIYVVNPLYSGTDSFFFASGQDIKSLTTKLATYDATIAEVPNIIKKAKDAKDQYDKISEDDRKKILTMVPVSVNDIKLMSEITNIGTEALTPIDGMGVKDKGLAKNSKEGEYSVSFTVLTTYTNFKKMMAYWESSMRLFRLQSVSFSPGKTEEEPIKFSVELSTYYMK